MNKILIWLFIAFILFLTVVLALLMIPSKPVENTDQLASVVEKAGREIKYSRITFFNTQAVKASMNIPEDWEGQYRLRDQGAVVHLYYIGEAPLEVGLLDLRMYSESDWDKKAEESAEAEIGRKDGRVITYSLSTQNVDKLKEEDSYEEMQTEIKGLVKTIEIN